MTRAVLASFKGLPYQAGHIYARFNSARIIVVIHRRTRLNLNHATPVSTHKLSKDRLVCADL